jgi:hypothetical protein
MSDLTKPVCGLFKRKRRCVLLFLWQSIANISRYKKLPLKWRLYEGWPWNQICFWLKYYSLILHNASKNNRKALIKRSILLTGRDYIRAFHQIITTIFYNRDWGPRHCQTMSDNLYTDKESFYIFIVNPIIITDSSASWKGILFRFTTSKAELVQRLY